jgi:hypothetical protein
MISIHQPSKLRVPMGKANMFGKFWREATWNLELRAALITPRLQVLAIRIVWDEAVLLFQALDGLNLIVF